MKQNKQALRPEASALLRTAVDQSPLRQTDLAVLAGVSVVYLNHMLQGRRPMRADVASKLARPLGLEPTSLFSDTPTQAA